MIYHYAHDFTRFARENKSPRTIIYGRLAAARAPDKRAFAKLRTQPQVPPALQPLYRAVAAR